MVDKTEGVDESETAPLSRGEIEHYLVLTRGDVLSREVPELQQALKTVCEGYLALLG